ncbi:cupin domain-containing protein [Gymnodinialimonas sp.]
MTQIHQDVFTGPHWTPEFIAELESAGTNGAVGSVMVSESPRARVWLIEMQPGERLPFHTHVLDYFWTATTPGRARSRYADGTVAEVDYAVGTTKHFTFKQGESMTHDLENIGDTVLCFTTVEYLDSANAPL